MRLTGSLRVLSRILSVDLGSRLWRLWLPRAILLASLGWCGLAVLSPLCARVELGRVEQGSEAAVKLHGFSTAVSAAFVLVVVLLAFPLALLMRLETLYSLGLFLLLGFLLLELVSWATASPAQSSSNNNPSE